MSFPSSPSISGLERPRYTGLWIAATLIIASFVVGLLIFPPQFEEVAGAVAPVDTVLFLGRFHPILVHLPVGILMFLVALELGCFIPSVEARYGDAALLALLFGSAGAVFAVIAGIMLSREGDYGSGSFTLHQALGIIGTAGVLLGLFFRLKGMSAQKPWLVHAYRLVLLGSFSVMGMGAHFGANMVHGSKYLTQYAPPFVRDQIVAMEEGLLRLVEKEKPIPAVADHHEEGPMGVPEGQTPNTKGTGEPLVFQQVILPMLNAKCNNCHNEDKSKGDLRMDTFELAMQGGESGENIIPGKPDDSLSIFRIMLPLDDDEHMPPEGKDQMTPEELALFRWWIQEGASNTMTVKDASFPEETKSLVNDLLQGATAMAPTPTMIQKASILTSNFRRATLTAAAVALTAVVAPAAESADKNAGAIDAVVVQVEKAGASLLPVSAESEGYRFTALNVAKDFKDAGLEPLVPVADRIISLDLARTQVTDKGMVHVGKMTHLKELRLDNTGITDAGLAHLAGLKELEYLNLYGSKVTDAGIQKLASMPKLSAIYLWQTGVTKAGVAQLHGKLPQASINIGWNEEDNAKPVKAAPVAAKTEDKPAPAKAAPAAAPMAKLDPALAAKADVFQHVVTPILANKCVACHGEDKTKGKLKLDTFANILKGGSEGDINVVAGKSGDSLMIQRVLLPHDDDEHMPPEDEPQVTSEELMLLKWWIDGGAMEKQLVTAAKLTPEVESALAIVLKDGLPAAPKIVQEKKDDAPAMVKMSDAEKKALAEVTVKIEALNGTLMPLAQDTELLRLSVINAAATFGDKELKLLEPVGKWVVWLDLARSQVTDTGLATIAAMPSVQRVHLENTSVTDAGVARLAALKELEYLNLYGTKVTDAGIGAFKGSTKLQKLYVWQTGVTKAAAKALEGQVAGLNVNVGLSEAEIAKLTAPPAPEPKKEEPAKKPDAKPTPKVEPKPAAKPEAKPAATPPAAEKKPVAAPQSATPPAVQGKGKPATDAKTPGKGKSAPEAKAPAKAEAKPKAA